MKKNLLLLLAASFIFSLSFSQSISPNENPEFCPLTDITFTVTLPRIVDNSTPTLISFTNTPFIMSGVSNLVHTSTQTTFTLVGRFRDVNINQVFRVQYATISNPSATYDPQFKRIKSLFYPTTCAQIPNQATITAPRCEAVNIPITISNVKWGAWGENPELCFGTITDYEYGLPAGWSIGSSVSTGSNWIPGGNSVTATSDLSNGGAILVRPRNTCGGATANGQTPGQCEGEMNDNPCSNIKIKGIKRKVLHEILTAEELESLYNNYATEINLKKSET
jgi:hypothetical protein